MAMGKFGNSKLRIFKLHHHLGGVFSLLQNKSGCVYTQGYALLRQSIEHCLHKHVALSTTTEKNMNVTQ
jgi:hypothetical protein